MEFFLPKQEHFSNYKQRFENDTHTHVKKSHQAICSMISFHKTQLGYLFNFNIVASLQEPKNLITYDDLINILEEHFEHKQNILVS